MELFTVSRKLVIVAIALGVASLHFVAGARYRGPARWFVTGYLLDLLIPFCFYLLLNVKPAPNGLARWSKAFVVLAGCAMVEFLQFYGYPVFGRTFDPLDFLVYATGVAGGLVFDVKVLSRLR